MILLTKGTSHKIRLTTDAAGDIEIHYSAVDKTGTGPASYSYAGKGEPLASVVTATTIDVLVGIASTETSIRHLSFYNNHASQVVTCTVFEEDGTDTVTHAKVVLAAGEKLVMDAAGVWTHYDANMGPYVGTGPFASQADMEAATSTTTVVSPNAVKWHPGVAKAWGLFSISGTTVAGFNVDAPTDNGTGDITCNITTDFSSASYEAQITIEMTATTYAVANARTAHIRFGGQAAGSCRCDCIDATAITQLVKDPTQWHFSARGDQ